MVLKRTVGFNSGIIHNSKIQTIHYTRNKGTEKLVWCNKTNFHRLTSVWSMIEKKFGFISRHFPKRDLFPFEAMGIR